MKLTLDLVPKTSWYVNVKSNVIRKEWDIIRNLCYKKAEHKCEICGETGLSQGVKHKVECHEIWFYNEHERKQILTGFIALCPNCHKTKHAGLSIMKGYGHLVVEQLMKVNGMTKDQAQQHITESFEIWRKRNLVDWKVDVSYIGEYLKIT